MQYCGSFNWNFHVCPTYPAIKFPGISFRRKNRCRFYRGIGSSGWRSGGLDSYSSPKFVQSRQIYCWSHLHSNAPHFGGWASAHAGLHIILSESGSPIRLLWYTAVREPPTRGSIYLAPKLQRMHRQAQLRQRATMQLAEGEMLLPIKRIAPD